MITGAQLRRARAAVRWSVEVLAEKSGASDRTILRFEQTDDTPQPLLHPDGCQARPGSGRHRIHWDTRGRPRDPYPQASPLIDLFPPQNKHKTYAIVAPSLLDVEFPAAGVGRLAEKSRKPGNGAPSVLPKKSRFEALAACLGPPPLLKGEDQAAYETLSAAIEADVEPKDTMEYLSVRDVIDLTWDLFRLRRLKASYLTACAPEGLTSLLQRNFYGSDDRKEVVFGWTYRDEEQVAQVNDFLDVCQLPQDAIAAETFVLKIDTIEKIERTIATVEARRLSVIREVDRRREALASQLRHATQIQDAEFSVIGEGLDEAAE